MNARPLVPEDIKRTRPVVYLARAATAHLKSFVTGASPASIAKSMWEDDRVTGTILRAASTPATTTTSGWAQQLAGVAILDLVQSITSISAWFAEFEAGRINKKSEPQDTASRLGRIAGRTFADLRKRLREP